MNLNKLLAENMVRFNTKNLTENQIKKILKEALGAIPAATNPDPVIQSFVTTKTNWGPLFKQNVNSALNLLNKYTPLFSVLTVEEAAAWLAFSRAALTADVSKNPIVKAGKSVEKLQQEMEYQFDGATYSITAWEDETVIQLNESPDEKGKVLTVGVVTSTGVTGLEPGNSSAYEDIIKLCNDYNIGQLASTDYRATKKGSYVSQIIIDPYSISKQRQGNYIEASSFTSGYVGQPGVGSLDIENSLDTQTLRVVLYSSEQYKAASGVSTGTQNTTITYIPGPEVTAPLPPNLFPILGIKLDPAASPAIATAIADMKKLGEITAVRVESGASYDRAVKLDNAGFAKAVGMQPNQVPADPTADAEGEVKDPMSGGNAFLAYQRGQAILNAIGNTAGVTPTMKAEVKTGGDAAQYARLVFTVKKADNTTTVTADDLKSIGVASSTEKLGGQMKIVRLSL